MREHITQANVLTVYDKCCKRTVLSYKLMTMKDTVKDYFSPLSSDPHVEPNSYSLSRQKYVAAGAAVVVDCLPCSCVIDMYKTRGAVFVCYS